MPPYSYTNSPPNKPARTKLFLIFLGIILTAGFIIASQFSFIEVRVEGSDDKEVSYSLQKGANETKSASSNSGRFKKLVRNGTYRIEASSGDQSFIAAVSAPGFLRTTTASGSLAAEYSRTFIGDSPSQCLYSKDGGKLISWQCGEDLRDGSFHAEATPVSPGYKLPLTPATDQMKIQGIVNQAGQEFVFAKFIDEHGIFHGLYPLDSTQNKVDLSRFTLTPGLHEGKLYGVVPYKQGYLVYSHGGEEYLYYKNLTTAPEKVDIKQTSLKDISLYGIESTGESIVILNNKHFNSSFLGYSDLSSGSFVMTDALTEEEDEGVVDTINTPVDYSEVVIFNGAEKRYKLRYAASQAMNCGEQRLCVVGNNTLFIYQVGDTKLTEISRVEGVEQIEGSAEQITLVTKKGIALFDTKKLTGHYKYTFGDYSYCGMEGVSNQNTRLLLCVQKGNKPNVLLIERGQNNMIDKKIGELSAMQEIKSLSVYKNTVFISPNIKKTTFDRALESYRNDPNEVAEKNKAIQDKLSTLGIDTSTYRIVFTAK